MKVKKSKNVHHTRDYTPVVRCTLNRRHKVSGTDNDSWGTGVTIAFPQKVDIGQMAIDINNAMSTSYRKIKEYVTLGEMEPVPLTDGYYRPHRRATSDGSNDAFSRKNRQLTKICGLSLLTRRINAR